MYGNNDYAQSALPGRAAATEATVIAAFKRLMMTMMCLQQ